MEKNDKKKSHHGKDVGSPSTKNHTQTNVAWSVATATDRIQVSGLTFYHNPFPGPVLGHPPRLTVALAAVPGCPSAAPHKKLVGVLVGIPSCGRTPRVSARRTKAERGRPPRLLTSQQLKKRRNAPSADSIFRKSPSFLQFFAFPRRRQPLAGQMLPFVGGRIIIGGTCAEG